jgi:hypothetical protein
MRSLSALNGVERERYSLDMGYWIKRIVLKSGEVVTERELGKDQNCFDGPVPVVGDLVEVECRGRRFTAKVAWGNWPGRVHPDDVIVPLRVYELGFEEATTTLRFPRREPGFSRPK